MDFAVLADDRLKLIESESINKYLDFLEKKTKKKTMEHESNSDRYCKWCTWNNPQGIGKRFGLVSLLTAISIIVGYLMPKLFS